jgi:hypothetical protein
MRKLSTSTFLVAGLAGSALAQTGPSPAVSASLLQSCRIDYEAHCVGHNPAPPIAAACLSQYYVNLSTQCRQALDAYNHPDSGDAG